MNLIWVSEPLPRFISRSANPAVVATVRQQMSGLWSWSVTRKDKYGWYVEDSGDSEPTEEKAKAECERTCKRLA